MDGDRELEPLLLGAQRNQLGRVFDDRPQIEVDGFDVHAAGLDLGEVEDVADDRQQRPGGAVDDLRVLALLEAEWGVLQKPDHPDHAVHGRADLVTHGREELTLGETRPLQTGVGGSQCI